MAATIKNGWMVYRDRGYGTPRYFRSKATAIKFAKKSGADRIFQIKNGKQYGFSIPLENSGLLTKLRKGIRGHIKLSRGRLIIKT